LLIVCPAVVSALWRAVRPPFLLAHINDQSLGWIVSAGCGDRLSGGEFSLMVIIFNSRRARMVFIVLMRTVVERIKWRQTQR
jgi:hypothetical protein